MSIVVEIVEDFDGSTFRVPQLPWSAKSRWARPMTEWDT